MGSVALMWGSSFALIDVAVTDISPLTVALLRIGLGALLLACLPGAARLPPAHALPSMLVLGLTIMAIPFASIAVAEQTISSAVAGMLQGLAPLTTALIAVIAFKEPLGGRHYFALALGTTGVILVSLSSLTEGSAEAVGVALMILAVASYGVGFNLAARLQPIYGGLTTTFYAQVCAFLILLPVAAASDHTARLTVPATAATLALGLVSTGIAFLAFSTLAGRVGGPTASITTYLVPAIAVALGVLTRGDTVAPHTLLGGLLILCAAISAARTGPSPFEGHHSDSRP